MGYVARLPLQITGRLIASLPFFGFVNGTVAYQNPITPGMWFKHKVLNLGNNRQAYWPVHSTSQVSDAARIFAGIDTSPGAMKGCYIQGIGGISIGNYTQIGPGVGIISGNHDVYDSRRHVLDSVVIGAYCWLGMGAKVMPGVTLGDFTVVGAGSIVTRSFPDGHCIIAGNPARLIRKLEVERCVRYEHATRYYGYIAEKDFAEYSARRLSLQPGVGAKA